MIEMFEKRDREGGENSRQVEKNKENEKKKAEEMRNLSMEKLEETLKRRAADDGQVIPKKRGSGTETLVYLRDKAKSSLNSGEEERTVSTNADVSSYAIAIAALNNNNSSNSKRSKHSAAAAAKSNAAGTN